MIRFGSGGKTALTAAAAGLCVLVAGCGSDSSGSASAQAADATTSMPIDRSTTTVAGMQIQGSPAATAQVGQAYSFNPTVPAAMSGAGVKFSITNTPSWAKFNTSTGSLTGT